MLKTNKLDNILKPSTTMIRKIALLLLLVVFYFSFYYAITLAYQVKIALFLLVGSMGYFAIRAPWSFNSFVLMLLVINTCLFFLYTTTPWFWALALVSISTLILSFAYTEKTQLAVFYLSIISMTLMVAELWFSKGQPFFQDDTSSLQVYKTGDSLTPLPHGYFTNHDILGYTNLPGITAREVRGSKKQISFDATYSINLNGFRTTLHTPENAKSNIDLVGDSLVFGQGVNDNQTLASQINKLSNGEVNARNLGIIGQGAHQVLAHLENNLYPDSNHPVDSAIYISIPDHVARSNGWVKWDRNGPLYERDLEGTARYAGSFNHNLYMRLRTLALKSHTIYNIIQHRRPIDSEVAQYIAILKSISKIYKNNNTIFRIIYWGDSSNNYEAQLINEIRNSKIPLWVMDEEFMLFKNQTERFVFIGDGHPNTAGHELMAQLIVDKIN